MVGRPRQGWPDDDRPEKKLNCKSSHVGQACNMYVTNVVVSLLQYALFICLRHRASRQRRPPSESYSLDRYPPTTVRITNNLINHPYMDSCETLGSDSWKSSTHDIERPPQTMALEFSPLPDSQYHLYFKLVEEACAPGVMGLMYVLSRVRSSGQARPGRSQALFYGNENTLASYQFVNATVAPFAAFVSLSVASGHSRIITGIPTAFRLPRSRTSQQRRFALKPDSPREHTASK
jgi:hypothetical protein